MKGRNGSLHVNVGLGGLETHPVLAVRLQAANPAIEENIKYRIQSKNIFVF
jgi:hypothetical protein